MRKLEQGEEQERELLKAVAQTWHAQAGNPKPTKEFDAQKNCFNVKRRPTRFKMEAINMASSSANWDFAESLLDSYEIVTLSKKLEDNLALDHPMSRPPNSGRVGKRTRESRNSLRNLFYKVSSKRFDVVDVPR